MHNYTKDRGRFLGIIDHLKLNIPFHLSLLTAVGIIGFATKEMGGAYLTYFLLFFWAYFAHVWAHSVFPWNYFHKFHHIPQLSHKLSYRLLEAGVNFNGCGGGLFIPFVIILRKFFNFKLFNNYIILFVACVYTSLHLINYHIKDVIVHEHHHKLDSEDGDEVVNYGPELLDILFQTKRDDEEYENVNHAVINIIVITVFILLMMRYFDVFIFIDHLIDLLINKLCQVKSRKGTLIFEPYLRRFKKKIQNIPGLQTQQTN